MAVELKVHFGKKPAQAIGLGLTGGKEQMSTGPLDALLITPGGALSAKMRVIEIVSRTKTLEAFLKCTINHRKASIVIENAVKFCLKCTVKLE